MQTITLTVSDEFEAPLEAFLSSQLASTPDPSTGAPVMKRVYATAADYFDKVICDQLENFARMYPTEAVRAKIAARDAINKEIEVLSRPTSMKKAGQLNGKP